FNPSVVKRLSGSGKPEDPLTTRWVEQAERLLNDAIKTTLKGGARTGWFKFGTKTTPKKGTGEDKDVKMDTEKGPPSTLDDRKNYGALLMKLAGAKNDPLAAAKILNSREMEALFPNEDTAQTLLFGLGKELGTSITSIRDHLNGQPPNLEAARTSLANLQE